MRRHLLAMQDIAPPLPHPEHRVPRDIFGSDSSPPPAPDYTPMAAASKEAAELGYKLGGEQLAESKRQYDQNYAMAQPIVDAQRGIMDQTRAQAADYYNYGLRGRSVEDSLNAESMQDVTGRDAADREGIASLGRLATGSEADIYNSRRGDIDAQTGMAVANARQGTTAQYNQLLRQGMRYGYSPQALAARIGANATQAGLGVASAANQTRAGAIANARGLIDQSRNYAMQNRGLRVQDDALRLGRKMDVAGLYRNMPGASQGAYGVAMGAGNSAMSNQMAPGQAYMGGLAQGAQTQQTGMGQQMTGLGALLNSQTSAYGQQLQANTASDAASMQMLGTLVGAGISKSDRRLKKNIRLVGRDERTGLNLYEFQYLDDDKRYRGVMADEVERVKPEAVVRDNDGYAMVNYGMLGIDMVEV